MLFMRRGWVNKANLVSYPSVLSWTVRHAVTSGSLIATSDQAQLPRLVRP